jgi:predicted membrane protein
VDNQFFSLISTLVAVVFVIGALGFMLALWYRDHARKALAQQDVIREADAIVVDILEQCRFSTRKQWLGTEPVFHTYVVRNKSESNDLLLWVGISVDKGLSFAHVSYSRDVLKHKVNDILALASAIAKRLEQVEIVVVTGPADQPHPSETGFRYVYFG